MNKVVTRIVGLVVVAAVVIVLVLFARRTVPETPGAGLQVQIIGGQPGAWNLNERMDGFKQVVAGTDIALTDILYNEENPETSLQVAENAINAHSGLRGFFASNAFGGPGAALAIKGAVKRGKIQPKQIHVVAFDTTEDILNFIEEGIIDCTLAQNTREMGRLSIEELVKHAQQYKETRKFDRPPKEKSVIDTGVSVVRPQDVAKYRQKLPPSKPVPADQPGQMRFALVPKSVGHPYWEGVRAGMEEAAERLHVKAVFHGPPKASVEEQLKVIEDFITQGFDGIGISPNDPDAVKDVIKRAMDKGIAVVTFDSDSPSSERLVYIGTDNKEAGRVGGKQMIQILAARKLEGP
jgi:ABC-type sugar transport system substrate-binding protein